MLAAVDENRSQFSSAQISSPRSLRPDLLLFHFLVCRHLNVEVLQVHPRENEEKVSEKVLVCGSINSASSILASDFLMLRG